MNNKHILDLTVRLSQALDQNYDVVNMDAVLSVISALEGATITKEQLEATRLAKYINQLRRRTKSEHLARRAKSLLKKWREMVVFQTNESASMSVQQQQQQHHHRSHPTSPTVVSSMEHIVGGKHQSVEFLRSTASNPAITSTSSGSTTINLTSNKRQASICGLNISAVPSSDVPAKGGGYGSKSLMQSTTTSKDIGKQPTSFANLLTVVGSIGPPLDGGKIDDIASPSSRKSNKRKDRLLVQPAVVTKTFVTDQSSSSNTELSRLTTQRSTLPMSSNITSEIIDIQDSNSDSEVNTSNPTPTVIASNLDITNINSKTKKSKKDKKRKDREQQKQIASEKKTWLVQNVSNIIEETCYNQVLPTAEQEYEKFVPIADEGSRIIFPISGISEILSLSNSSMNSMFPNSSAATATVVTGSGANEQNKTNLNTASNSGNQTQKKPLLTSDLTFAGKFKSSRSSGLFSGFNLTTNDAPSDAANLPSFVKTPISSHPFVPFNNSGGNSNDSTSNSRTSQFDIIDVVNQDNSQSKIIDELRLQNKKQSNDLTSTTLLNQHHSQNKLAAGNRPLEILLPPTSNAPAPSTEVEQKIPKKRGRKKGSKGVDSLIAKETSLCSQMLMTTLGTKKVKTTKELYTEMQNRKLVSSTTSSPTLSNWLTHQQFSHISRPNSSCSEPSLPSSRTSDACSTNATVSTIVTRSTPDKNICNNSVHGVLDEMDESFSEYNTSDLSRDSTRVLRQVRRGLSTDSSNSNMVSKVNTTNSTALLRQNCFSIESIEKQIKELQSHLPPVQSIDKILCECNEDAVPCTCKVIKVQTSVENLFVREENLATEVVNVIFPKTNLNKSVEETTEQQSSITDSLNKLSATTKSPANHVKNFTTALPPEKPKKSIFDLDFEEDEDPLHKFVAEAAAKQEQKAENIESTSNDKLEENLELKPIEPTLPTLETNIQAVVMPDALTELQPSIIIPTYEVNEDPNCLAKKRYEIQTQKVTQFHVTALHNCYIPNVNGNWDDAESSPENVSSFAVKKIDDLLRAAKSSFDIWHSVIPQYGSLIEEYIPKDLSHINFTSNFKPRKTTAFEKRLLNVPFLGVARRLEHMKGKCNKGGVAKTHIHEKCPKVKTDFLKTKQSYVQSNENYAAESAIIIKSETNNNEANACIMNLVENVLYEDDINSKQQEQKFNKGQDTEENNKNTTVGMKDSIDSIADANTSRRISNEMKESNKVFSGITIDIEDDVSQNMPTSKCSNSVNTYLLTLAKLPEVLSYHSYENQNDQNINNNSASPLNTIMYPEDKSSCNTSAATIIKNVDSRRSSSCSNSSLKQTQNSINLKLRRRRLQQQQQKDEENKSSASDLKPHGKRRYKSVAKLDEETSLNKRPRLVRSIKIAINGDIATQRQISIGSSNNSTDEDDDEDYDCFYSAGSRSSPVDDTTDEFNVVTEDCEEEEYIDDDEDDEEDDDYAGDYHEVVTRDIAATSSGNNHIVLTIKKTPSKTNSPSDSLSAMSPVPALFAQPLKSHAVEATVSENIEEIVKVFSSGEEAVSCEARPACNNSVKGTYILSNLQTPENDIVDVKEKPVELLFVSERFKKRVLKKRNKKIKEPSSTACNKTKLHHQLFFPYELFSSDLNESLLNISSCSSSCAEGSEYEYDSAEKSSDDCQQENINSSFTNLQTASNEKSSSTSSACSTRLSVPFYSSSESISAENDNGDCSLPLAGEMLKKDISAVVSIDALQNINAYITDTKPEAVTTNEDINAQQKEEATKNNIYETYTENNGNLKSFNNIYITPEQVEQNQRMTALTVNVADEEVYFVESGATNNDVDDNDIMQEEERQQQKLPFENCDVYNNFCNNNNNSKLEYSNSLKEMVRFSNNNGGSHSENLAGASSSNKTKNDTQKSQNDLSSSMSTTKQRQLIPQKEYRTGIRAVDEDVDDDDGNNCARIQKFKEWHQVLQLRSYNDELLTVLPYVVLE